jgi:hypothetical protein
VVDSDPLDREHAHNLADDVTSRVTVTFTKL